MVEIKAVPIDSAPASELFTLLKTEWPELNRFTHSHLGLRLPSPLAAIMFGKVIGGLSYISYRAPDNDKIALWVNAVFVLPGERGRGVATALLKAALYAAPCIYALTNIPTLYTNLGFKVLKTDIHGTVVKFENP